MEQRSADGSQSCETVERDSSKKGAIMMNHREHFVKREVLWCLGSFHTLHATSRVASYAFQPANLPSRLKPKDSLNTRRLRQTNATDNEKLSPEESRLVDKVRLSYLLLSH